VASITTWMRLEPRCRTADMSTGLQARIYDPLWLMARQWQTGEFQGEDNGSPAVAQWRGESARFTRYQPGPLAAGATADGLPFDGNTMPLETMVEREPRRPQPAAVEGIRFAVESGQQFLRMLDQQVTSRNYRAAFVANFPFAPLTTEQRHSLDSDSLSFVDLLATRVPDGRKLYPKLSAALRPVPPAKGALPADLGILPADAAEVESTAKAWFDWYDTLITQPASANASWSPERMEYGFSIGARTTAGEKVLTAQEYYSGHVDWHDFSLNVSASLRGTNGPVGTTQVRTTIPAPVSYRGMPAPRFWQFEDAQVDFGAVDAGREDLAKMLLIEFAITYGNDWFVVPIELDVGSLCRTQSLIVTNTFGERFLVRSSNDAGAQFATWRMFQLSSLPKPGAAPSAQESNLFMLPPSLVNTLESRPIEEVHFLRDEMANMAWGVEKVVESAIEQPLNKVEQQRYEEPPQPDQANETLRYQLATEVPENWVPLLPVQSGTGLRLKVSRVLKADGSQRLVEASGRILNPDNQGTGGLAIFEEEIPREGVRVARTYQLARWQDGSTHLWIGRRKTIGRGEGSSGLRFDVLKP
jgi:hypothetical protein